MGPPRGRRYRTAILLGCLLMMGSGFLPWWRAGGDTQAGVHLPASAGLGLEGPGLVVFGSAVLALIVLDLGYMRGGWSFSLDRPAAYLVLGLAALAAVLYRGWQLWSVAYVPLPQTSPGLAVAALGVGVLLYGVLVGFEGRDPA